MTNTEAGPTNFSNPKTPKVLHVIDNLKVGGAQRLLVTLAECPGVDAIEVLELDGRDSTFRRALSMGNARLRLARIGRLMNPLSLFRVSREIYRSKPNIVHLHLTYATILCAPISRLLGCRVVVSLHNVDMVKGGTIRSVILRSLEGFCIRNFADYVIHVGEEVRASNAPRLGQKAQIVIPNVLARSSVPEPADRHRVRAQLGRDDGDIVLVSTGRLNPQKDHVTMLAAFAEIAATVSNAYLWIAGTGAMRQRLDAAVASLDIADRVIFLGERDDIPDLLAAADVFLLSSAWEGLPLGLLEALAHGLPIISTDVGDVKSVVTEDVGILVPPKDPRAFADAIRAMCADSALRARLSQGAKAAASPFTNVDSWVRRTHTVYTAVLSSHTRREAKGIEDISDAAPRRAQRDP